MEKTQEKPTNEGFVSNMIDWSAEAKRKVKLAFYNFIADSLSYGQKWDKKEFREIFLATVDEIQSDLSTAQYQVILDIKDSILDDIDSGIIKKYSDVNNRLSKAFHFVE